MTVSDVHTVSAVNDREQLFVSRSSMLALSLGLAAALQEALEVLLLPLPDMLPLPEAMERRQKTGS